MFFAPLDDLGSAMLGADARVEERQEPEPMEGVGKIHVPAVARSARPARGREAKRQCRAECGGAVEREAAEKIDRLRCVSQVFPR